MSYLTNSLKNKNRRNTLSSSQSIAGVKDDVKDTFEFVEEESEKDDQINALKQELEEAKDEQKQQEQSLKLLNK